MPEVMWPVVLVLIILVQGIQSMGDYLVRRLSQIIDAESVSGAVAQLGHRAFIILSGSRVKASC